MKRRWQALFALALAAFLFVTAIPLVYSQPQVLPNQTEQILPNRTENDKYCQQLNAVCLDGHFLFFIFKGTKDYPQEKRVELIKSRIKEIAEDPSINPDSIRIESWTGDKPEKSEKVNQVEKTEVNQAEKSEKVNKLEKPEANQAEKSEVNKVEKTEVKEIEKTEVKKVSNSIYETTNIVSPHGVIVTLTKSDIEAAKVGFNENDKEKLANIYLQNIKNHIELYRKEHHIGEHFGWIKNIIRFFFSFPYDSLGLISVIILGLVLLILLIGLIRWLFDLLKNRLPRLARRFVEQPGKFIVEVFGLLLQILLIIMILVLIARLILIFFNANFIDVFFDRENLTNPNLDPLFKHVFTLLQIIGLLLLFGLLALVLSSLSSQKECIIIRPFENDTKGQYPENIGKAITDSLIEELERIRQIYALFKDVDTQDIKLAPRLERYVTFEPPRIQENPLEQLQGIGTVAVSGTSFTLDPILLYLRHVWPFGGVNTVITGSLQTYNSDNRLVAKLSSSAKVSALEVTHPNQPSVSIPEMIRELAFKIAWSLQTPHSISAKTWEGFKWLTEATAEYYQYRQNGKLGHLDSAYNHCQESMKAEKHYESVADLFYLIGIAYLEQKKCDKAEQALQSSIQINPRSSKTAYFHNGLGNVYYVQRKFDDAIDQYNHAIRLTKDFANFYERFIIRIYPKNASPYNGLGNVYFEQGKPRFALQKYKEASKQDFRLWKPYNNLGIVYLYYLEDYNKAEQEFEKAIKCDSNQRICKFISRLGIGHCFLNIDYCLDHCHCLGTWTDKISHPHSGLGLAYFYQAIILQGKSARQEELFNKAIDQIQKAIDIDSNVAIFYWNLGLIRLGKGEDINEVIYAWKRALKILEIHRNDEAIYAWIRSLEIVENFQDDETHYTLKRSLEIVENYENDDEALSRAIYRYVINVFQEEKQSKLKSEMILNIIELLLKQEIFFSRTTYLKILKTDLETISEILKNQNPTEHQYIEKLILKLNNALKRNKLLSRQV